MPWSIERQEWIRSPRVPIKERSSSPPKLSSFIHVMEVAPLPKARGPGGPDAPPSLPITRTFQPDSEVVATIRAGDRVRAVATCMLPDGTKRMCVALERPAKALGFVTAAEADGTPRARAAPTTMHPLAHQSLSIPLSLSLRLRPSSSPACPHALTLTFTPSHPTQARRCCVASVGPCTRSRSPPSR